MTFAFEKLNVYQKAVSFADAVCSLTKGFPRGYFFLADQLNRASLSIAANIAEGNGRFTKADRRNFFIIARGSVQECVPFRIGLSPEAAGSRSPWRHEGRSRRDRQDDLRPDQGPGQTSPLNPPLINGGLSSLAVDSYNHCRWIRGSDSLRKRIVSDWRPSNTLLNQLASPNR